MMKLLWKPSSSDAVAPKLVRQKKRPTLHAGRVVVTCLRNGWCPGQNLACERAKRAAEEFKNKVVLEEIDTFGKETGMEWGT
jgi:hypothetical protein